MNKIEISKKIGIILMVFSIFCYMLAMANMGNLFGEFFSDFGNGTMLIAISSLLLSIIFRFEKTDTGK